MIKSGQSDASREESSWLNILSWLKNLLREEEPLVQANREFITSNEGIYATKRLGSLLNQFNIEQGKFMRFPSFYYLLVKHLQNKHALRELKSYEQKIKDISDKTK